MTDQIRLLVLIGIMFVFYACDRKTSGPTEPLNYSKPENWLQLPSEGLLHDVDVFYVYPTVYLEHQPGWMDVNDQALRDAATGVLRVQGGVFTGSANLFAPMYRQVSIGVLDLPEEEFTSYISAAYEDVKDAFEYYLENLNQDRPFILAGHSQGSEMILELMKDKFADEALQKQLVAAYIIGYSVTKEDTDLHPWMRIAQSDRDVGVIITYNTQSADAAGSPVLLPGAHCVNPLNWTTAGIYAADSLNLGAVFFNRDHKMINEIPAFTGARIDKQGALVVDGPDPDDFFNPDHPVFPRGVYHAFDYNFFYRNLEENVALRIKHFPGQ